MKRTLMTFVGVLFWAAPALAGNWLANCVSTTTTTWLQPGQWACYKPASINDDSADLNVASCENFDVLYHVDIDGDGTASTTTLMVRSCPSATSGMSDKSVACWAIENAELDGDPSTNTESIYGVGALLIYADMQNNGTINDPQVTVLCRGPAR